MAAALDVKIGPPLSSCPKTHQRVIPISNRRFLALFGWTFQKLPANEFLICAEKPNVIESGNCFRSSTGTSAVAKDTATKPEAYVANLRRVLDEPANIQMLSTASHGSHRVSPWAVRISTTSPRSRTSSTVCPALTSVSPALGCIEDSDFG